MPGRAAQSAAAAGIRSGALRRAGYENHNSKDDAEGKFPPDDARGRRRGEEEARPRRRNEGRATEASSCRGEQRMCSTPGHGQNQGRGSLHSLHADVESVQGLGFESGLRQGLGVNRRVLLWQKDGVESGPARRQQKYPTRQQLQPRRHTRIEGHGGA